MPKALNELLNDPTNYFLYMGLKKVCTIEGSSGNRYTGILKTAETVQLSLKRLLNIYVRLQSFTMDFQVDPDQSEMYDELEKRGLKASNIHTKEDEIKVLQMIRAIPRPIYMKRDMK